MAYGTVNADVIGTSVTGSNLGAGNASLLKNRLINGAMVIDQRNAGASVTVGSAGSLVYTLDRWAAYCDQNSKFSVQQNAGSVTPPTGFSNYLGATSLSAYTVGSSEAFGITQIIEGFNTADLGFGSANAQTVTLSFWVRSSLTGTFGGSLRNSASNRSYPFSYTISSANTWEKETITITGDTSGTWIGATNGSGLKVWFSLGAGSTYNGTVNTWAGANYLQPTGATSVVGTNGATFYITGVQLEVGSNATGFEYVNYQTSLANCQRYYQFYYMRNLYGYGSGSGYIGGLWSTSVPMRVAPTVTTTDLAGNANKVTIGGTDNYSIAAGGVQSGTLKTQTYFFADALISSPPTSFPTWFAVYIYGNAEL